MSEVITKEESILMRAGETAVTVSPDEIKTSVNKLDTLEVGQLTDEEMKRFELGPYSKNSTANSVSV